MVPILVGNFESVPWVLNVPVFFKLNICSGPSFASVFDLFRSSILSDEFAGENAPLCLDESYFGDFPSEGLLCPSISSSSSFFSSMINFIFS
jgi:hypothetical protein